MANCLQDKETRRELAVAAALIVFGVLLRTVMLGALPFGLNQDEASAGYEAYALLTSGIDRCGKSFPALFVSWGSGQNVLMSYLAMPFVAAFGLSELTVRLPNAIAGCITLPVFWLCARSFGGRRMGLAALLLLAVNPWHIMASRWALESNLLPLFLLGGIWLTAEAEERPWCLVGAAACFGLSLYAYGTAFFFLPPFLVFAVIRLRKALRPASFLTALAVFILLALPVALCQLINVLDMDEIVLCGVTLPRLTQNRQAATSVFGGGLGTAAENFRGFLRILMRGNDGLPYNALGLWQGGVFYFFGLPTAALGFVASLFLRRDRRAEGTMRLALLCALLCAFCIDCNINRINMIWLPLIYFSAFGCHLIFEKLRRWAAVPVTAICLCALLFVNAYGDAMDSYAGYFPGLGAAVEFTQQYPGETVYITDWVNQPYIFALFYTQPEPERFVASVEYRNPDAAFRSVRRFDGFEFENPDDAGLLILHRSEAQPGTSIFVSGDFVVCEGSKFKNEKADF